VEQGVSAPRPVRQIVIASSPDCHPHAPHPRIGGFSPRLSPTAPVISLPLFPQFTKFTTGLVKYFTEKPHIQKELPKSLQSRYDDVETGETCEIRRPCGASDTLPGEDGGTR
jgi:hypothetical protein